MKETTALEFKFGTRTIDEKKQKFSIYELGKSQILIVLIAIIGGGRILSSLLASALNAHSI
jgi:hypothetical protein